MTDKIKTPTPAIDLKAAPAPVVATPAVATAVKLPVVACTVPTDKIQTMIKIMKEYTAHYKIAATVTTNGSQILVEVKDEKRVPEVVVYVKRYEMVTAVVVQ